MSYRKDGDMLPDMEYQRAPAWKLPQQQLLIDSILRGYGIPVFYFHHVKVRKEEDDYASDRIYVIDGQQRLDSIHYFVEGKINLLPKGDKKIPRFLGNPPWAGRAFSDLGRKVRENFLSQEIHAFVIESGESDKQGEKEEGVDKQQKEIRDLFIRLQGGAPLHKQEVRDAWPGEFTEYILHLGGKKELDYSGHEFFRDFIPGAEKNKRMIAAQVTMLYLESRKNEMRSFPGVEQGDIDDYYRDNASDFSNASEVDDFNKSLTETSKILKEASDGGSKVIIPGYEAIHVILLVKHLLSGDYVHGWEGSLFSALLEFRSRCKQAEDAINEGRDSDFKQYWTSYHQYRVRRVNAKEHIERRNFFFVPEMLKIMNLKRKDPKRGFSSAVRESVYVKDGRKCQVCRMKGLESPEISFADAHIHHILPHADGGQTTVENGALTHKDCHPRGKKDVKDFRDWWESKNNPDPPDQAAA